MDLCGKLDHSKKFDQVILKLSENLDLDLAYDEWIYLTCDRVSKEEESQKKSAWQTFFNSITKGSEVKNDDFCICGKNITNRYCYKNKNSETVIYVGSECRNKLKTNKLIDSIEKYINHCLSETSLFPRKFNFNASDFHTEFEDIPESAKKYLKRDIVILSKIPSRTMKQEETCIETWIKWINAFTSSAMTMCPFLFIGKSNHLMLNRFMEKLHSDHPKINVSHNTELNKWVVRDGYDVKDLLKQLSWKFFSNDNIVKMFKYNADIKIWECNKLTLIFNIKPHTENSVIISKNQSTYLVSDFLRRLQDISYSNDESGWIVAKEYVCLIPKKYQNSTSK